MSRAGWARLIGLVLGLLAPVVVSVPALAAEGPARVEPAQVGPAQLNPTGRTDLCWQAAGNGSPVTLEHCDSSRQGQQWALTGNGVLMNGNGYCLEAGTGHTLLVGFDGQCAGESGQLWAFSGSTGRLSSHGGPGCAVPAGSLVPGTEIVTGACDGTRWSFGYSAVTLAAGTGAGAGNGVADGGYTATVTAANAATAQIAYGVTVRLTVPPGLTVTGLRAGAPLACRVATLTCSGSLAAGGSARIGVTGRLPAGARPGTGYTLSAAASVQGTSPAPGTAPGRAAVPVAVHTAVAGGAAAASGHQGGHGHGLLLAAVLAGLLLAGGGLLVLAGRRSRRVERRAGRPGAGALDQAEGGDDGPYVVDVTDEVRRRQEAQQTADLPPTEPFDVSSIQ